MARLRTRLRDKQQLERSRQIGQFYLEMLFGIGSAITSPFKVDDEIEIILRQALLAVGASRGTILLLEDDGQLAPIDVLRERAKQQLGLVPPPYAAAAE